MINLMLGDCLERMKEIESGSVDMILTDPPYGTTACKWDSIIPLEPMWLELNRIIKPNGAIVLFGSEPFSSALRMSNIKNYKYDIIWDKSRGYQPMLCKKRNTLGHEVISMFYNKQPFYSPQMCKGKPYKDMRSNNINSDHMTHKKIPTINNGERYPYSVVKFPRTQGRLHPTQKPVALMEYLIKTYSNERETVLDFTMGSGTTGVAAKNLNRDFIGIEMGEGYFKIAQDRIGGTK
jgi:DNA modification methylase